LVKSVRRGYGSFQGPWAEEEFLQDSSCWAVWCKSMEVTSDRHAKNSAFCKIKARHRVVPSRGPVDSDEEVHPDGQALLPVVLILVDTPGGLQADFVLDD
jgi:hypothetical protein